MIIFKYFFKVLKKYMFIILMFTAILIAFAAFSLQSNNTTTDFTASKPKVIIINNDENVGITKGIYEYMNKNAIIQENKEGDDAISDALFYRDVNYVISIPKNYNVDFMNKNNPKIEVKSAGDYMGSYAQMLLDNYIKTANIYLENGYSEEELVSKIDRVLDEKVKIEMTTKLDTEGLSKAKFYYNFANYSILAICIFVVATIMCSFREFNIKRRTMASSTKARTYNCSLFFGILVLGIALWAIYCIISVILLKDIMLTTYGLFYFLNSFIFTICALSIAFLVGNVMNNKEAINGISNVIALGSSFLCGSFVPVQFLPDIVVKIAHILPSYWYIQNNELIATIEQFNLETLMPFIQNSIVILAFTVGFILLNNILYKRNKK